VDLVQLAGMMRGRLDIPDAMDAVDRVDRADGVFQFAASDDSP